MEPGAHEVHTAVPGASAKVPTGQETQMVEPFWAYVPATQGVQVSLTWMVPPVQGVQVVWLLPMMLPGEQVEQAVAPDSEA